MKNKSTMQIVRIDHCFCPKTQFEKVNTGVLGRGGFSEFLCPSNGPQNFNLYLSFEIQSSSKVLVPLKCDIM